MVRIGKTERILDKIWNYAKPTEEGYEFVLFDEMFYYYHLAHMAKHIEGGGCGIRPFIDLWLLLPQKNQQYDLLLKQGGLENFEQVAVVLTNKWFECGISSPMTDTLERFVISGGVGFNYENHTKVY